MFDGMASRPLDEEVWQAWLRKGRDQDARAVARRMKVGKWLLLVATPGVLLLWFFLERAL
jgi:hypothetical protein